MICPTCKAQYANGAFCANDGTALVDEPRQTLVGQVLAERYRIVRLLGEGGMGQVYEAQHLNINKRFAIKMLRPEVIGSPQSLQRFRQEAWAASSIGHENIVEIDDFATLPSGQVYLAMEFLDGQSLAERIRDERPIAIEDAVAVMIAVAHGLGAAHDKGIVHRDMKPENVFLARKSGRVVAKILDFGIAKMTGGDEPSNLTRTGAIFGTPLYMSPEQARGKPADARADVYAVGVILYELLTGSVPFGGESSVEILSQHIGATPVPPTELAPERAIPPALEALVLRALAKEPDARVASMAELARALEEVAATLPAPALAQLVTAPAAPPTGWNAQLTPAPGATTPRPAAVTPRPMARTPTGPTAKPVAAPTGPTAKPVAAPTGPTAKPVAAAGASPSRQAVSQSPVADAGAVRAQPPAETATALEPARSRGGRNLVLALLALALVGGGAVLLLGRRGATTTQAMPTPQPLPAVPPPEPVLPSPAPSPTIEVIVDSLPTGARILRDGVVTGETPEALKLTGATTIVLHKEGFADKEVAVDPSATRKLVVKLERARAVAQKPAPSPKPPGKPEAPSPKPPGKPEAPSKTVATGARPATPPKAVAMAAKPGEPVDPYASPSPPKTPPKGAPPPPRAPHDELSGRVEKQGASSVPGGHRLGTIYRGAAAEEGGRSDWYVDLEGGHCYTFVGEGGDGVKKLFLYLWGPRGKRLTSTREDTPHPTMSYCTAFPGNYHFQAKVDDGQGEYRVGIYAK